MNEWRLRVMTKQEAYNSGLETLPEVLPQFHRQKELKYSN